jgi:hypothetical protein
MDGPAATDPDESLHPTRPGSSENPSCERYGSASGPATPHGRKAALFSIACPKACPITSPSACPFRVVGRELAVERSAGFGRLPPKAGAGLYRRGSAATEPPRGGSPPIRVTIPDARSAAPHDAGAGRALSVGARVLATVNPARHAWPPESGRAWLRAPSGPARGGRGFDLRCAPRPRRKASGRRASLANIDA